MSFEDRTNTFVEALRLHFRSGRRKSPAVHDGFRRQAEMLQADFQTLFAQQPALDTLRPTTSAYRWAFAHKVLDGIATGRIQEIDLEKRMRFTL